MTAWPRAIVGQVRGMARPRRPVAEIVAVREAAEIVRRETGATSVKSIALEISRRVVAEMLADIEQDDPLVVALAALEQQFSKSPIIRLATCAEIDTAALYIDRCANRLRARSARRLNPAEQDIECRLVADQVTTTLGNRYDRILRS